MTNQLSKCCLFLGAILFGVLGPIHAGTCPLPKIISDGFATYREIDATKAVDAWFAGSLLANDARVKTSCVSQLKSHEATYGAYDGYECAGSVAVSPSVCFYYIVILYDSAPLYASFEVYTIGGKAVVTSYRADPRADQILPAYFFQKNKPEKELPFPHESN